MNMPTKPEPPRLFLQGPTSQDLLRRIAYHAELLARVKAALPETMAGHCQYCLAREDKGLVIFADAQAFAAQLRFFAPSILAKLNASQEVAFTKVLVRSLQPGPPGLEVKPMPKASPVAIAAVKACSQDTAGDELAVALAKLGATMERHAKGKLG